MSQRKAQEIKGGKIKCLNIMDLYATQEYSFAEKLLLLVLAELISAGRQ